METLFWLSALLIAYVYVGYPLLLAIWAAAAERPVRKRRFGGGEWPSVSVVLAAHNEAEHLKKRVENLLELQYPRPLEIVVVSDGSTDGTAEALARFDGRVRLTELPRGGKPRALNAGVAASTGDIVVFADARQRFAPDAIAELVANFHDPDVGGVTGELILDCEERPNPPDSTTIADGVGLYWKYEKWLRRRESGVWSTLGATGAIYALRRSLWRPLPPATLLDDVLAPMRVVLAGWRVVFEERARAFDRVSATGSAESRRKIRTLAGNYQLIGLEPRLLLPFANPVWIQYTSHKIARLLVPWALLAAFVASVALAAHGWVYSVALMLQTGFYGLAAFGGWLERQRRDGLASDGLLTLPSDEGSVAAPRISDVAAQRRVRAG